LRSLGGRPTLLGGGEGGEGLRWGEEGKTSGCASAQKKRGHSGRKMGLSMPKNDDFPRGWGVVDFL